MVRWKPQFTFPELPLWDATAHSKPACKLQLIEMDINGVQSESIRTAVQTPQSTPILLPPADTAEPSSSIAAAINLQLTGAMKQLQEPSPVTSASASQHSTPVRQPLPAARESENPLRSEGTDSITPAPMATLLLMSLQVATPAGILSFA